MKHNKIPKREYFVRIESRIRQVIEKEGLNLKEFSEKIQVSYRTIQNYLHERRTPSAEFLLAVHTHLGISTDWLLTGKGQMYFTDKAFDEYNKLANSSTNSDESRSQNYQGSSRAQRLGVFINYWLQSHSNDEQAWFEIEFKRQFTDYADWLVKNSTENKNQSA